MSQHRQARLAQAYQREITQMLIMELRDPRLEGVSITSVALTPDLRLAKVYFVLSGGREREPEVKKGFEKSKGFIKRELASRVQIKYAPELEFHYDDSAIEKERLDALFEQIKKQESGAGQKD